MKAKGSPTLPSITGICVTTWLLLLYLHVNVRVGLGALALKAGLCSIFLTKNDTFISMFASFSLVIMIMDGNVPVLPVTNH